MEKWKNTMLISPKKVKESGLLNLNVDEGVFYKSLGSVGGCNHFIEYNEQADGDLAGLTCHFGSRNFGTKVCNYWMKKTVQPMSKNEMKEKLEQFKKDYQKAGKSMKEYKKALYEFIEGIRRNHINGYLTGEYMGEYLMDMCFCQLYAQYNHITVQNVIKNLLQKYGIKEVRTITSTHNFIDLEDHCLRKSAIRSYEGEEILVPFNMRDGVAICEGLSNSDWLNSCAHGAGRKMSRSKAKQNISMKDFEKTMEGVYSTTVCKATLDESPMAYKDTTEIKDLITETCKIKFMMIPKINIKAADGGD